MTGRHQDTHTHRHTLLRENVAGAPILSLGRDWGWVGWASLERDGAEVDVMD